MKHLLVVGLIALFALVFVSCAPQERPVEYSIDADDIVLLQDTTPISVYPSYNSFWFNAEHIYVRDGNIHIKPDAPAEFTDVLAVTARARPSFSVGIRITRPYIALESITLTVGSIIVGEPFQIIPTFTPINATIRTLQWEVTQGSATITQGGIITATALGNVVVRATSPAGVDSILSIPVNDRIAIHNATQLSQQLRLNRTGHFILRDNIILSGQWTPIRDFSGSLEGNNFTISNMQIVRPGGFVAQSIYLGLFGHLSGTIRNLNFENCVIEVDSGHMGPGWIRAGIVAGSLRTDGRIENVNVINGRVAVARENATIGGITGGSRGDIIGSSFSGTMHSNRDVGGIAGTLYAGTISNNTVEDVVLTYHQVSRYSVGGIVGFATGGQVTDNVVQNFHIQRSNSGELNMGAIVGHVRGNLNIHFNSFSTVRYTLNEITRPIALEIGRRS